MKKISIHLLFFAGLWFFGSANLSTTVSWVELEEGLSYASIPLEMKSMVGDSKVDILKIDPMYFSFNLYCKSELKGESKTADVWAKENNCLAMVNAGMFKLDGTFSQCTGYMKNFKHVNNGTLNPSYKNVFVFNAKDSVSPKAQIVDLTCDLWEQSRRKYQSFSQGIRMLDCEQKTTWQKQEKQWSMVLLGQDKKGGILFIFVRSPYRVHDFINQLNKLPIQCIKLMYLEGGPEASFVVNHPSLKLGKMGSYETGFNENDANHHFWELPNVIGIKRKD